MQERVGNTSSLRELLVAEEKGNVMGSRGSVIPLFMGLKNSGIRK